MLPFLLGDRLVGRVDLKADRQRGRLRVNAAYVEDGEVERLVAGQLAEELALMARWLGLEDITVARRGNLSAQLRKALGGPV